jgi:hypothetical protein
MKPVLLICAIVALASGAVAQSLPNLPKLPTSEPSPAPPSSSGPVGSLLGNDKPANPIDQAKTEIECKLPSNATKRECIELMPKPR